MEEAGVKNAMPQTVQAKMEVAADLKDRGNAFFKEGQFSRAKVQYCTALAYTKGLPGRKDNVSDPMTQFAMNGRAAQAEALSEEVNAALQELDATLKTNVSVCLLKMNKPAEALQYAKEALLLKPSSWKAMLRKGEALLGLRQLENAMKALDEALATNPDPGNRISIMAVKNKVAEAMKSEERGQKKAFKNLFERANLPEHET